jgi:hypothetical protein
MTTGGRYFGGWMDSLRQAMQSLRGRNSKKKSPKEKKDKMQEHLLVFDRFRGVGISKVDTLSLCFFDGKFICLILEDEYREIKLAGETRIPSGRYRVILEHSPKFSIPERYGHKMLTILGVPTHSGIRIHKGRLESHTDGCPLTGEGFSIRSDKRVELSNPDSAYKLLYEEVSHPLEKGEIVWLEIVDEQEGLPEVGL